MLLYSNQGVELTWLLRQAKGNSALEADTPESLQTPQKTQLMLIQPDQIFPKFRAEILKMCVVCYLRNLKKKKTINPTNLFTNINPQKYADIDPYLNFRVSKSAARRY